MSQKGSGNLNLGHPKKESGTLYLGQREHQLLVTLFLNYHIIAVGSSYPSFNIGCFVSGQPRLKLRVHLIGLHRKKNELFYIKTDSMGNKNLG